MNNQKVLFLFTKLFPFGYSEQYIHNELNYLTRKFDKVILVPCEYFSKNLSCRELPLRCEILDLNGIVLNSNYKNDWYLAFKILVFEFFRVRKKIFLLKRLRRYFGILNHQLKSAKVLKDILRTNYADSSNYFYAYWMHNSSVMLINLLQRKIIDKFISRGHAIDMYEFDWKVSMKVDVLPFYNYIVNNTSKIISISKHGENYLSNRFTELSGKFFYSRLGVNQNGINPFADDNFFTIVSCSSIDERKNVFQIAEVVKKIKAKVKWIHFGGGDDKNFNRLKDIVSDLPLTHIVELRGRTDNELVLKYYGTNKINLFINLSEAEGIPVALMEAISFGIPVLATEVYGNPEIACAETGFCVAYPPNTDEIVFLIEDFIKDVEKQKLVRNSTREFYNKFYNAEANYNNFINKFLLEI